MQESHIVCPLSRLICRCQKSHSLFVLMKLFLLAAMLSSTESWKAYDRTAYTQCKSEPKTPLYRGGILTNPEFNDGLTGWTPFGNCVLQLRSCDGNSFVVAANRTASYNGPSQIIPNVTMRVKYSLSAWIQISGSANTSLVKATVTDGKSFVCAGTVIARSGCWSFLKGGFSLDSSPTSTRLYFETANVGVEIWLDSVSLQPFSEEEWRLHQNSWIEGGRRRTVSLHFVDSDGRQVDGAEIRFLGVRMGFPFGSAIAKNILDNESYQRWFLERFNTATFENELKWYATEPQRGRVDYNTSDRMLALCKANKVAVRGHNIVWEDGSYQPGWVREIREEGELAEAVQERIGSVVGRYAGDLIAWDVSNEMLHFSFFEERLGSNASIGFYLDTQQLDPSTTLFLNDFNVIETCYDPLSTIDRYIHKIRELQTAGVVKLGVGLEAHFLKPNLAFMRASLDKLGALGLPIWLTEVDINNIILNNITQAATYLEEVLREAYSHPAVEGIVMWTAMHPSGSCYRMCLTDANFQNLPTGDVVDELINEWSTITTIVQDSHHCNDGSNLKIRAPIGTLQISVTYKGKTTLEKIHVARGKRTQHVVVKI